MDQEEFELFLKALNSEGILERPEEARYLINSISSFLENDLSSVEAQLYIGLAADLKTGLFAFLNIIAQSQTARVHGETLPSTETFQLLTDMIVKYPNVAEQYAADMVTWGISLIFLETPIRPQAIKMVELIIVNCPCINVDLTEEVQKLVKFLNDGGKIAPTLKRAIFSLISVISEHNPNVIDSHKDWFIRTLAKNFKQFETAKNVSVSLLEGCFIGLEGFLKNFSLPPNMISEIYPHLKSSCAIKKEGKLQRLMLNRAALNVFTKHNSVFFDLIYKDFAEWHGNLNGWLCLPKTEDHHSGILAFTAFYEQIAAKFLSNNPPENAKQIFDYLKKIFDEDLSNSFEKIPHSRKRAVVGISVLSGCYSKFACEDDLRKAFGSIAALAHTIPEYMTSIIGVYLVALAKISAHLQVTSFELSHLFRLIVLLIERYPNVPSTFQKYSLSALENCFNSLYGNNFPDIDKYLQEVLYQCLLRTCAHRLHIDAQILEETEKIISYKSYVDVWVHLLTINSRATNILISNTSVGGIIYDIFIAAFLDIITKLDLRLTTSTPDYSDPELEFEAISPNDFLIFNNLVDLFLDLIPVSDTSHLEKWLANIINELLSLSAKNPLVSGFYKLLGCCLSISNNMDNLCQNPELSNSLIVFLRNTAGRINSQKGDLQIACLTMILLAPSCLIESLLGRIPSILLIVIRVGRGYPVLLKTCLACLERWRVSFSSEQMEPIFREILPMFDAFLQSPGSLDLSENSGANLKLKKARRKRKTVRNTDRELLVLQKQFLIFLGKLEPGIVQAMATLPKEESFTGGNKLNYNVPFPDVLPTLDLNIMVPRIMDLSLSSADRNTRVTACELLNAFLLLGVARSRKPHSNPILFKHLLSTALTLSCDPDKVVSDLFRPLLLQITHYFSGKVQLGSVESATVIEVLLEGATHPYNLAVRDFSAQCVKEFVIWSVKQMTPEELAAAPQNIRAILRTLCTFAVHPDRCKRLGCAIVFNNIYATIREEETILENYWFELFAAFMRDLGMCKVDEDAVIIDKTLEHIVRPLSEKSWLFLETTSERRVPIEFRGGRLNDLVLYAFQNCNSSNVYLRKAAQGIVHRLVTKVSKSLKTFLFENNSSIDIRETNFRDEPIEFLFWLLEEGVVDPDAFARHDIVRFFDEIKNGLPLEIVLKFCIRTCQTANEEVLKRLASLLFQLSDENDIISDLFVELITVLRKNELTWDRFRGELPAVDQGALIRVLLTQNNPRHYTNFVRGFFILHMSGALSHEFNGKDIFDALLSNIFTQRGRRTICTFLDSHAKLCARRIFGFTLEKGIDLQSLVTYIVDDTEVDDNGKVSKKGKYIFDTFESLLVPRLVSDENFLDCLLNYPTGYFWLMLTLSKLKTDGSCVVFSEKCLDKWDQVKKAVNNSEIKLLMFLEVVTNLQPLKYGYLKQRVTITEWFIAIFDFNINCLTYDGINRLFNLLPQFSSYMEDENLNLSKALKALHLYSKLFYYVENFRHTDIACVESMYKGILSSMRLTGSTIVAEFLTNVLHEHLKIVSVETIDEALGTFISNFPASHAVKVADKFFKFLFTGNQSYEMNTAVFVVERLSTMLVLMNKMAVYQFFSRHLLEITAILKLELNKEDLAIMRKKIFAVRLMEALYLNTKQDDREKLSLEVVGQSGSEFFKEIFRLCSFGVINKGQTDKFEELRRLYHCACVTLRCAYVSQFPKNDEKPFAHFLFYEATKGKPPWWSLVVDVKKQYDIAMDFKDIPKRKKVLTSIRGVTSSSNSGDKHKPLAYAHSQTLFESTLSEDVQKFDLTHAVILNKKPDMIVEGMLAVELELDSLNQHEVMAAIVGVVHHMVSRNIQPEPGKKIPCWLRCMINVTRAAGYHYSIRMLSFRFILNLEKFVGQYIGDCASDIVDGLYTTFNTMPANYLLIDILFLLIRMKPKLTENAKLTVIIRGLIERPGTSEVNVLKFIFEVCKGLIECWGDILDKKVLTQFILQRMVNTDAMETYINLNFISILLANNCLSLETEKELNYTISWIFKAISSGKKNSQLACEVLGMILAHLTNKQNFVALRDKILGDVRKIHCDLDLKINQFYHIHKFFPGVTCNIISILIDRAWSGSAEHKRRCLEMLLSHVTRYDSIVDRDLQTCIEAFLVDLFKSKVIIILELTLQIVLHIVTFADPTLLRLLCEVLIRQSEHSFHKIRQYSCQILIKIIERFKADSDDIAMVKACEVALLKRINDHDEHVQKLCEDFWWSTLSETSSPDRLLRLFRDLYAPEAESEFVEYACRLLIKAATLSPQFNKDIEDALTDCKFTNLQMSGSWRMQHSSITAPMFAPSMAGEMNRLDLTKSSGTTAQLQIRATAQSLLFQPTLDDESSSKIAESVSVIKDEEFKRPSLPRRFNRSKTQIAAYFAKKSSDLQDKVELEQQDKIKQREAGVQMYRTYRYGDYPDVQIKHSQFLITLLALASKDEQIARQLFVGLATSIADCTSVGDHYKENISDHIGTMLQTSCKNQCIDKVFIGSIFEIALSNSLVLDSGDVCRAAKCTGLLFLGSLLIEHALGHSDEIVKPPKRSKRENDDCTSHWLRLAQLYLDMDDVEGLHGVFLDKLEENRTVKRAISHEALLEWSGAANCYKQLLEEEPSQDRINFYGEAYFNCLAHLSNWSALRDSIKLSPDFSCLWEDPEWSDFALPHYMRAEMMSSFYENNNNFQDYVKQCETNGNIAQALNGRFMKELSLSYWLNDRMPKSIFHLNQAYLSFLNNWSQINVWDIGLKRLLLNESLILSELQTIVGILSAQTPTDALTKVIEDWQKIAPDVNNDLIVWDVRLAIRRRMQFQLKKLNLLSEYCWNDFDNNMTRNQLLMAEAAAEQGNIYLANTYLKFVKSGDMSFSEQCLWKRARNSCLFLQVSEKGEDIENQLENYRKVVSKIDASHSSKMDDDSLEWRQLCAYSHCKKLDVISKIFSISKNRILSDEQNLRKIWIDSSNLALDMLGDGAKDAEQKGVIYLKMAKFYREQTLCEEFAIALLKAMRFNNVEARQLFGSVLTMDEAINSAVVEAESSLVPSWMFLVWRQQLLSFLSQGNANLAKIILRRLAKDYPHALSYNVRMAKESNKSIFMQELSQLLLSNVVEEKLVNTLALIACPRLRIRYHVETIIRNINTLDTSLVIQGIKSLKDVISNPDNGDMYSYVKVYLPMIDDVLGLTEKSEMDSKLRILMDTIMSDINNRPIKLKPFLKTYSPWLASYHWSGIGPSIEIPGQYNGTLEPKVKNHVHIAAFKPDVSSIPSKTKPFKITFIGHDARYYSFLIKFGEDLRQDDRIQQVFRHMNTTLLATKLKSKVECYEVIPLSSSHGLIQWVENIKSLRQLITAEIEESDIEAAQRDHLNVFSPNTTDVKMIYMEGYRKTPIKDAIESYKRQSDGFSKQLLRRQLWKMCGSPEQFVYIRNNFATSLAVLNIATWIVGVGDRHLDNILVSKDTGQLIGIDFGLAFGLATSFLPIPELVPFRLTPQMINVLSPLNESGWLKQTMLNTLHVLREDPVALLSILEVFVREPAVNWQQHAERLVREQWGNDEDTNWYPRQKIDAVLQKLSGTNPVECMKIDLKLGHEKKCNYNNYLKILEGNCDNVRSKFPDSGLTTEDQINCLLDLATDPAILAFTYVGWNPWL